MDLLTAERKTGQLTNRWTDLREHAIQTQLLEHPARFKVVPAGRRSGKTELAKRNLIWQALDVEGKPWKPAFFAAAPTRDQAKRIFWKDLKAMIPRRLMKGKPSESELVIELIVGSRIHVVGMDVPERIEGTPWDGGILDEYGNMKASAWMENVRPALSDRKGWCWMIGVPEGRNHYYNTYLKALADPTGQWAGFTWKSADILDPEEIESAKRDLDELTYQQEYEGSFISFQGRAYYQFFAEVQGRFRLPYNPESDLVIMLDFNVAPGVAAVGQEMILPKLEIPGTGIIGEVWIPVNSNTPAVMRKLLHDWGEHKGKVFFYGDATGGAKGSAKIFGTDWDIVKEMVRNSPWHGRAFFRVGSSNPPERSRVNAMNSRIMSTSGEVRLMVDPVKAPHVIIDLEGVKLLEGGSGEIDKADNPMLTHISDAIGYYIAEEYPVGGKFETEFY